MAKNTRLVYRDDANLRVYESLPDKDFKEFMMVYLTYEKGDNVRDRFTNPQTYALFMSYVSKIEYNEDKWEKRAAANRENGKKGGRKPKEDKTDIPSNTDFDSEISENKDSNISNDTNPQPIQESVSNQKGINENEGIVIDSWEAYRNVIAKKVQAS